MADVALAQSSTNNGTATPATPGSLTATAGNLLVLLVAVQGTSPTISTPASWTQVQNSAGATLSTALFIRPNNPGGASNPSATLGGTPAGWIAVQAELTTTGSNEALISSAVTAQATAALTNIFPTNLGQALPGELFLYGVARTGNTTLTGATSGLNNWAPPGYPAGSSQWSASVQGQTNIQGLSIDLFWGTSTEAWPCPYPQGAGTLSGAVASVQIGAWLNSSATSPTTAKTANIGGGVGSYVGPFNAGMVGG